MQSSSFLHLKESLNKMATPPPPLFCVLASLITLKLGGVDSVRREALLFWFNQVSVQNIKSRLCSIIKSLIKNVFPAKDLMFSKDSFNVSGSLSASFLITGCGSRGTDVKFTKFTELHRLTFVFL